MKARELEWLVNEIARLRSVQRIDEEKENKREENLAEIRKQYKELENKYNSLSDAYQASLRSNVELQKRYDENLELYKNFDKFLEELNEIADKKGIPAGTDLFSWTIKYIKTLERTFEDDYDE